MSRKCKFKEEWTVHADFKAWIKPVANDVHRAYCTKCEKSFDVSNMGISALKSHAKGRGHQSSLDHGSVPKVMDFFKPPTRKEETAKSIPEQQKDTIATYFSSDAVLEAEIHWVLKMTRSHFSFNSCVDMAATLQKMAPDSEILKRFSCGATKASYLVCFGLAPYFRQELIKAVREADCYVISFDECLNKVTQTEQMDLVVRYWSDTHQKVMVRYLDSQFMGHTQAEVLLENMKKSLSTLDPNKLLQISMDGPRVNWKFVRLFQEDRLKEDPDVRALLNLGSCALHTVHGSLQKGAKETGWRLGEILRSLWQLFHDSPARRDDYQEITKCQKFPLKFCAHRWVEDLPVAERAIELWPSVKKFIKQYKTVCRVEPTSASYITIKKAVGDPLFEAKLEFFMFVARTLKPFLESFQRDAPMVPFLAQELKNIILDLMRCFLKKHIIEGITTLKLLKINVMDKDLHMQIKDIDIGFATKQAIESSAILPDNQLLYVHFKKDCLTFLARTTKSLLENCPLNYPVVRYLRSLDPFFMVNDGKNAIIKFEKILQLLLNAKWLTAQQCDHLLAKYKALLMLIIEEKKEFSAFNHRSSSYRVDSFLSSFLSMKLEFSELWSLFKCLLTLSHGQAAVERGYSVNKDTLVGNLKEKTLISLRLVQDGLSVEPLDILPKSLIKSCRSSRTMYMEYLDNERKNKKESQQDKRRRELCLEIGEHTSKRKKILSDIKVMEEDADLMAQKAADKRDFTLLVKSNAYRQSIGKKKEELILVDSTLSELKEEKSKIAFLRA